MEPVRDAPWQEHEKVYLLAEIIKNSPVSSNFLYQIIRDHRIQPRWDELALPYGRNLRSCQTAYGEIATTYSTPDYRQQPLQQQPQPPRPQLPVPSPILYPGSELPKKRAHQPETATSIGRLLQPRPTQAYPTEYMGGPAYAIAPQEPPNKKKRGRPTKAEAQARADAALARGEIYPPPRKGKAALSAPSEPSLGPSPPGPSPPAQARPGGSSTGALPGPATTAFSLTTTPQQQPTQPEGTGSESTSSKKKRSKPTPLELEKAQRDPSETASPSVFGSATGDTSRTQAYSTYTPISAPLPSANDPRDRDVRMEGTEESQPRTTTPRSFKDTVGI